MSIERTPLSTLTERTALAIRVAKRGRTAWEDTAWRSGFLIVYEPARGKNSYVATVSPDDLFDYYGNRFDTET